MGIESHGFAIPTEITESVMDEANAYDETLKYAKLIFAKAKINHPALYSYMAQTAREQVTFWFSYGIACALSYDIISRYIESLGVTVLFTKEDLTKHKTTTDSVFSDPRWNDDAWVLQRAGLNEGTGVDSGIGLFLNTVYGTAPRLRSYIAGYVLGLDIPANRKPTLRGFYDGFMPLYRKIHVRSELNPQ